MSNIVPPLPANILQDLQPQQLAKAEDVLAALNWIINNVNANAEASGAGGLTMVVEAFGTGAISPTALTSILGSGSTALALGDGSVATTQGANPGPAYAFGWSCTATGGNFAGSVPGASSVGNGAYALGSEAVAVGGWGEAVAMGGGATATASPVQVTYPSTAYAFGYGAEALAKVNSGTVKALHALALGANALAVPNSNYGQTNNGAGYTAIGPGAVAKNPGEIALSSFLDEAGTGFNGSQVSFFLLTGIFSGGTQTTALSVGGET